MKKHVVVGTLISTVFLALALRDIEWSTLWHTLQQTRLPLLALSIALTIASNTIRAYRWKFMIRPLKPVPMNGLLAATWIGLMANNLLPARLGEIVRAHVLGRKESVSRTASFATIVYERVVDVFSVLFLVWITLFWIEGPSWLRTSSLSLLVANVALLVMFVLIDRYPEPALGILARMTNGLPARMHDRVNETARAFVSGLASVSRADTILPIVLTTLLLLAVVVLSVYFCLEAVGIHLPIAASAMLFVLLILGSMIPSAPAYVGTYQYACIIGLSLFGVDRSEALAFSLVYNAAQFFPVTAIGFYYLWREGLHWRELRRDP